MNITKIDAARITTTGTIAFVVLYLVIRDATATLSGAEITKIGGPPEFNWLMVPMLLLTIGAVFLISRLEPPESEAVDDA
jgi:uncharacterized membrane protein